MPSVSSPNVLVPPVGILSLSAVPLGLLHPPLVNRLELDVAQDEPLEELGVLAQEARDLGNDLIALLNIMLTSLLSFTGYSTILDNSTEKST